MSVASYSVKRPVTVVVLYALALGVAATLVPGIAVDLFPATAQPVLSVYCQFPGAGPLDVEQNVTAPLERALASSKGLVNMTSNSQNGGGFINLNYEYGTDMDKAASDAQTVVSRVAGSLPDGAGSPTVRRFDMSAAPILRLIVRGSYPSDQLRIFAEEEVQAELERIDGVAAAEVTGGSTQLVRVAVSLNRLAALDLTLSDVSSALRGQNVLSSGGSLQRGERQYQLLTRQELKTIDDIRNIAVKTVAVPGQNALQANRSQIVRLQDVADVTLAYNDNAARVYVSGDTGVYIQVTSEADSNSVQVARRVKDALAGINTNLPRGITLEVLSDNTSMISATMQQVYGNALQGAVLAMAILFLFLRSVKGTLIIGLSIPISILLTLMCMAAAGFSLNLLTMTGLILGLGMTVDASIVILDNIHNYRMRGAKPDVAAILGSAEMMRAIVTSTTTTLCVFLPLIIYKNSLEQMGQLFSDLIFTVVISLTVSLVVSITLVPSLAGSILKLNTRKQKPLRNRFLAALDRALEKFFTGLDTLYTIGIKYCLNHRGLVLLFVLSVLAFSLLQFSGIGMNMFLRTRTDDSVNLNVTLPQGTTIEVAEALLQDVERMVQEDVQGYLNTIVTARSSGGSLQITLPAPAQQIDTPDTIIAKLTPKLNEIPGARLAFRAGRNMGSSTGINVALHSRDVDALMAEADDIVRIIERYMPDVENPVVNMDEGAPQLQIEIDRNRAAALGISLSSVASEIRTAMDGTTATTITQGDKVMNVVVRLRDADRKGLASLDAIFVNGRGGARIPLANVARIVENRASSSIRRENQERVVRVTGDFPTGVSATEGASRLRAVLGEHLMEREGVTVEYQGEAAEVAAYNMKFLFIIAAAVFLVFGLMASQFESFVDPIIIFFSIPLIFIGVIWIYKLGGENMSMFSAVGIVALVGVVVNNGIVLVDYTNTLRARGMKVREACLEAGRNRLRPILMTSLTTILGMVPIAFFPGPGADMIQPIGKTFVGGLTVSSFLTLFITPVMYSLLNSRHDRPKRTALKPVAPKTGIVA
ncbi:MAG: efflux RND transporter permease subunit [Spirochaetaceae bacterium]|jgi:HAE1 family hydrophobic/amphiphilic exporter-1|nr:efflux RND transporter permease subunit [Spirochaetaceae bacterium]